MSVNVDEFGLSEIHYSDKKGHYAVVDITDLDEQNKISKLLYKLSQRLEKDFFNSSFSDLSIEKVVFWDAADFFNITGQIKVGDFMFYDCRVIDIRYSFAKKELKKIKKFAKKIFKGDKKDEKEQESD